MTGLMGLFDRLNEGWRAPGRAAVIIASVYGVVVGTALVHHEMWRDEIEAWLIARDSRSVPELLAVLKNEGHPALWYLLLMPLTRLSRSPEIMQGLHLTIATAMVYLVARWSPLSRLQQVLFPLGFFVLWQYAVVSRNYALGVLLLVAFCALYQRRHRLFPVIGLLLMLAAHTHLLILLLVIAITAGLAVDCWEARDRLRQEAASRRRAGIVLGFVLIAVGVATSLVQLLPDRSYVGPVDSTVGLLREHGPALGAAALGAAALVGWLLFRLRERLPPVLAAGIGAVAVVLYFDSSVLGGLVGASGFKTLAFCGLAVFLFQLSRLRDRLPLLLLYGLGTTGLLLFFSAVHSGGPHHHGLLFVVYLIGYWLDRLTRAASPASSRSRTADAVFTLVLAGQAAFGLPALYQDLTKPYSNGKAVADAIRARGLKGLPVVGCVDFSAQTVLGYLGAERFYYPQGERWGSFVIWDRKRYENVGLDNCLRSASAAGGDVLVVSSYTTESSAREADFVKVAEFLGAIRDDENFILYRSKPAETAEGARTPGAAPGALRGGFDPCPG